MSQVSESPNITANNGLLGLNDAQRQAVEASLEQNVQVLAGAGTGKTKMLSHRVVHLAKQLLVKFPDDNPFEKLFVATFSDKAASHLYDSINALWQTETGYPLPNKTWIGTLHSLSYRILSFHHQQNHIPPKEILNKLEQLTIQEEFIQLLLSCEGKELAEQLMLTNTSSEIHALLCPNYWLEQGITDIENLLTDIVLYLIPQIKAAGLTPQAFLKLASQQSIQFLETLKTLPVTDQQTGEAFNNLTDWVTCWEAHLKPHSATNWQLYPTPWTISIETIKAETQKTKKPKTENSLLLSHIRKIAKENYLDYNATKKTFTLQTPPYPFKTEQQLLFLELQLIHLVSLLYEGYQNLLAAQNACDFDDILLDLLKLAETNPISNTLKSYQEQFQHYLIDEFQDTNGAQLALIQRLSKQTQPITVVGDIKQSIYGFRYAQPENLNSIFSTRDNILKVNLSQNYRSHHTILKLANRVADFLELPSEQHYLKANRSSEIRSTLTEKSVQWHTIETTQIGMAIEAQNHFIQTHIQQLIQATAYQFKDIAILVPNHQYARHVEENLKQANIPAIRQKSLGFFSEPLIQAVCHWLQWLAAPDDNMALIGWLQYHFSPLELAQMAQASLANNKTKSYTDYILNHTLNNELQPIKHCITLAATYQSNLTHQALEKLLTSPDKTTLFPGSHFEVLNLEFKSLQTALFNWHETSKKTPQKTTLVINCLKRAMSQNELELPITEAENTLDAIQILTTHASKGLEFPVVFLAGVESYKKTRLPDSSILFEPQHDSKLGLGLFFANYQNNETLKKRFYKTIWHAPQRLKENLNLLYVAITRAKERLIITHWKKSFEYLNPQLFD